MSSARDQVVLIAPPFSTSSSPYISLPTLMSWLKKEGITTRFLDLGRDLEKSLLSPSIVVKAYDSICKTFAILNGKEELLPSEVIHLTELQMLLRKLSPVYQQWQKDEFRNADRNPLMELISLPHWPHGLAMRNGANFRTRYTIYSSHDLTASGEDDFFFTAALKERVEQKLNGKTTLIAGISIVFDQQIIPAMQCARIIKELFPDIHVTLGGPFVTIHLRHLQECNFFKYVDSMIVDEGEKPLVALHQALLQRTPDFQTIPNLIWPDGKGGVIHNPSTTFVDLGQMPAPDYQGCELGQYPDPESMQLTVRLSKGCSWKRCAFCRVTLSLCRNYSQPDADTVYRSFCEVMDATGVTNFLFSDESCSPEILAEISDKLCADQRKISWSFHTRIDCEKLTRSRLEKFKRAGCTGFAVGIETYNDRLLKLMNKGITEKDIDTVLHDLKGILPIKAYMMLGLPTETEEEFIRSFQMIRHFRENGLLAGVQYSLFELVPGSLMWKRPDLYGISKVDSRKGADLMPNNITGFVADGMSRSQAFTHYMNWIRRKIPKNNNEIPVDIKGKKHFMRYDPKNLVERLGDRFSQQLDSSYVAWLDQIDTECAAIRGCDPWWMIGD